jgi:hypothetical protein
MTWTKLGNELLPEINGMSDAAALLHIKALMWSNWRLLDLMIPRKDLPMFGTPTSATLTDAINELVEGGWWQQDKAQVEHRRAQLALAQRRKRLHDIGDHRLCLSSRCKAVSTVDSTVESCDDPVRLRNGTVTGTPTTKTSLGEEWLGSPLNGSAVGADVLRCDWCGSGGETRVDGVGRRVCVGRCDQDALS